MQKRNSSKSKWIEAKELTIVGVNKKTPFLNECFARNIPGVCADPSPGKIYESEISVMSNRVMQSPTS